jgi:predicted nucleic acid-binding protein
VASVRQIVIDASVGVKWFRDEPGSDDAREFLRAHGRGEITLVVPSLFVYEVVAVATRVLSASDAPVFWQRFMSWRLGVVEVGAELVDQALVVREQLGCSFYDAVAPALAGQLGVELCSADRKAHGEWPNAVLLG